MSEKFLIISRTHSLLPLAHRLKLEGHDVEALVSVPAFERAWAGKLRKVLRNSKGEVNPENLESVVRVAESGELTLLIDDWGLETVFRNAPRKYGVYRAKFPVGTSYSDKHTVPDQWDEPKVFLRLGGWFTGEKLQALHGLIVDRGAWPGGMGPEVDGAGVMIRIDNPATAEAGEALLQPYLQQLKSQGFRGLVQFGILFDTRSGEPEVQGVLAGWPWLQTHSFLSDLEGFGDILLGRKDPVIPKKLTTVVPISRPPWPARKARFRKPVKIENLTDQQMARVFWHDVRVDEQAHELWTAGLDGLVGVSRGSADTLELSKGLALEPAARVTLPEKQYRTDVGAQVPVVLGHLEALFGLTF